MNGEDFLLRMKDKLEDYVISISSNKQSSVDEWRLKGYVEGVIENKEFDLKHFAVSRFETLLESQSQNWIERHHMLVETMIVIIIEAERALKEGQDG